jgi:hypothetical protein
MLAVNIEFAECFAQPIPVGSRCSSAGVAGSGLQIQSKTRSLAYVIR